MPNDANHTPKSKSRRGRKQKIGTARSDFTLEDARERAPELRARYAAEDAARRREARTRSEILAKAALSPLRRALRDLLQDPEFKAYFGPIDAVTLQNQLSLRKKIRNWEPPDRPVEQEEAQATWEAQQSNYRECNQRPDGAQKGSKPGKDAK